MPAVTRNQSKKLTPVVTPVRETKVTSFNCGTLNCRTGQFSIYKCETDKPATDKLKTDKPATDKFKTDKLKTYKPATDKTETETNYTTAANYDEFKRTLNKLIYEGFTSSLGIERINSCHNVVKYCLENVVNIMRYLKFAITVYIKMREFEKSVKELPILGDIIHANTSGFLSDSQFLRKILKDEFMKLPLTYLKQVSYATQYVNFEYFNKDVLIPLTNKRTATTATPTPTTTMSTTTTVSTTATEKKELERRSRRKRKHVDYTGMDTIEPLNEYDGITNIWADETIYEDPNWEPFQKIPSTPRKTEENIVMSNEERDWTPLF